MERKKGTWVKLFDETAHDIMELCGVVKYDEVIEGKIKAKILKVVFFIVDSVYKNL